MKRLLTLLLSVLTCLSVFLFGGCNDDKAYTFYCPDGAPALSIAGFIAEKENFDSDKPISYNVVSATEINNAILKEDADFVIMPLNTATKLYKNAGSSNYKMVAVITHGNFYLMSKTTLNSAEDLLGKVIHVPQSGKVPDLTLQASLSAKNIPFESGDAPIEGKVVLNYSLVEAGNIVRGMMAGNAGIEIGLIPEPAATNLSAKGFGYQLSLQELYDVENKSYPQAVLMVKESIVKREKELIFDMANSFAENVKFAENNPKKAVEGIKGIFETSTLADNLSASAVKGCNIYWQGAETAEDQVENYIDRIRMISVDFANQVDDDFFM